MAAQIIAVLSKKYLFNAEEALAYYEEHKDDAGSTTSISTVQRAENALNKTKAEIEDLKSKIPAKKGKMLENANAKLVKLEEKLAEQTKKLQEKKEKEEKKAQKDKKKEDTTPKKPKKEKAETPKAPKKAPKEEDDKRIKRISPTMSKQLTKVFEESNLHFQKENGQFFAKYVNELTKEDFEAKNLADHMRDYVGILSSSLPVARQLSPDFDVKEPEEVPDEDMIEIEFNDVEYVVGDISGRVYEADAENGDRFVGFIGVGKFHDMKKPE